VLPSGLPEQDEAVARLYTVSGHKDTHYKLFHTIHTNRLVLSIFLQHADTCTYCSKAATKRIKRYFFSPKKNNFCHLLTIVL